MASNMIDCEWCNRKHIYGEEGPYRHAKTKDVGTPQKLHLPVELLDIIAAECHAKDEFQSLYSLRLVCRSFANGLFDTIMKTTQINIFLDEDGIKDLEGLVKDVKQASNIRGIKVGLRRVAHFPVVLKRKTESKAVKADAKDQTADEKVNKVSNALLRKKFYDQITLEKFVWAAERYGFDADCKNSKVAGCKLLPRGKDYTPSEDIIQRFVKCLEQLPNLKELSSCEQPKHVTVIVQDGSGIEVARRDVKVSPNSEYARKPAYCVCGGDPVIYDGEAVGWKPCKSTRSMCRSSLFDFAKLPDLSLRDADIWDKLKEFSMNIPNTKKSRLGPGSPFEALALARALYRCSNLEKLRLWSIEPDHATTAAPVIIYVLSFLHQWGVRWSAELKRLALSSVSPVDYDLLRFLDTKRKLISLEIKNCFDFFRASSQLKRKELHDHLNTLPELSLRIDGRERQPYESGQKMRTHVYSITKVADLLDDPSKHLTIVFG